MSDYGLLIDDSYLPHPQYRSRVSFNNDTNFLIYFSTPRPNWFRRFWYWALLGWKWEAIEEGK